MNFTCELIRYDRASTIVVLYIVQTKLYYQYYWEYIYGMVGMVLISRMFVGNANLTLKSRN